MARVKTVVVETNIVDRVYADIGKFGKDIEVACNSLEESGYEVISIVPVTQGHWASNLNGYGWSTTQGVVVTARERS